jgi:hypothetical protein
MTTNFVFHSTKILAGLVKEFVYFPIWWYTKGFLKVLNKLRNFLVYIFRVLAIDVWVTNLFKPMYGQQDLAGKLISFFMRVFQIIVRSIAFFFVNIFVIILGLIWLAAPLVVLYELLFQII